MKEQLVSFETAKLAREKGFNVPCLQAYRIWRGNLRKYDANPLEEIQAELEPFTQYPLPEIVYFTQSKEHTLAPTQSLLQKWLREEHNVHITIDYRGRFYGNCWSYRKGSFGNIHSDMDYSYDEILEKLIQKALKSIQ
jgi:hypothetical protein